MCDCVGHAVAEEEVGGEFCLGRVPARGGVVFEKVEDAEG